MPAQRQNDRAPVQTSPHSTITDEVLHLITPQPHGTATGRYGFSRACRKFRTPARGTTGIEAQQQARRARHAVENLDPLAAPGFQPVPARRDQHPHITTSGNRVGVHLARTPGRSELLPQPRQNYEVPPHHELRPVMRPRFRAAVLSHCGQRGRYVVGCPGRAHITSAPQSPRAAPSTARCVSRSRKFGAGNQRNGARSVVVSPMPPSFVCYGTSTGYGSSPHLIKGCRCGRRGLAPPPIHQSAADPAARASVASPTR